MDWITLQDTMGRAPRDEGSANNSEQHGDSALPTSPIPPAVIREPPKAIEVSSVTSAGSYSVFYQNDPETTYICEKLSQPPALLLNSLAEKMTDTTRSGLLGALLHLLITTQVITNTEAEQVKQTPEGRKRASHLVGIVITKSGLQLKTFVDVLKTHCPSGYQVFHTEESSSSGSPNHGLDYFSMVNQTKEVSELLTCMTNVHCGRSEFYSKLKAAINSGINVQELNFDGLNLLHEVIRVGQLDFLPLIQYAGVWSGLYNQRSRGSGIFSNLTPMQYAIELGEMCEVTRWQLDEIQQQEILLRDVEKCIREGNVRRFRELKLRHNNDILTTSNEETSLLEYACQSGDLGMLREVIRTEQELGYARISADNAVTVCVSLGHHTFLQVLMEYVKVDLNQVRLDGGTLIENTAVSGDEETFRALLRQGAQLSPRVVTLAAANNRLPFLQSILRAGGLTSEDINFQINFQDDMGRTAAHIAVEQGQVGVLRLLLEKDLDLTLTDKRGFSILHSAVSEGSPQVVKEVLEFSRRRGYLDTILTARHNYVAANCCFCVKGSDGVHPAWHYVMVDKALIEVFKKKMAEGVIDVTNYGTILKSGWGEGPSAVVVKEIVEQYDVATPIPDMQPLHLAILKNHDDVALQLIREMEYVGQPDRFGLTPLHLAAMKGSLQVMTVLLQKGARIEAEDDQGRTPMNVAVANDQQEAVNLLMPAVSQHHLENMRRTLQNALDRLTTDNLEQQEDPKNYTKSVLRIVKSNITDYECNILGEGPIDVEPLDQW